MGVVGTAGTSGTAVPVAPSVREVEEGRDVVVRLLSRGAAGLWVEVEEGLLPLRVVEVSELPERGFADSPMSARTASEARSLSDRVASWRSDEELDVVPDPSSC